MPDDSADQSLHRRLHAQADDDYHMGCIAVIGTLLSPLIAWLITKWL